MQENPSDPRLKAAEQWTRTMLRADQFRLRPVSGDASFRRYFRIHQDGKESLILMDAPPDKEDSRSFLDVANRLRDAGLRAPRVFHFDLEQGYGIIEDFGDELYRSVITAESADTVFPVLFDVLAIMANRASTDGLPPADEAFLSGELSLFEDWYLAKHRGKALAGSEQETWKSMCRTLLNNASEQPQVFVHRDFHSCNLLYNPAQQPGIIDFQDAVVGPVSYDFISLIWDRYIHWPRPQLETWMEEIRVHMGLDIEQEAWVRYCDLMGLQRNLKIVGIFARLYHRDSKQGYLEMIPVFYQYLLDVLPRYPEFSAFQAILEDSTCAP